MGLGPTDKITTDKLQYLFIDTATSVLVGSTAPPTKLNKIWWATLEAAINLALRYQGKVIQAPPYYPQVNHRTTFDPEFMWYLNIGNANINAAELAQSFTHYPEDTVPNAADNLNKQLIQMYQNG